MKSAWNKMVVSLTACGLLAALLVGVPRLAAQEKKVEGKPAAEKAGEKKVDAKKETAPKEGEKKERAKPKGKLPNYYSDVVSGEQREKIYAIQAKFAAEIEKLQEQLKALEAKVDAEVEAVLTPEQKDKVAKAAAASKTKRAATAEEKKKEGGTLTVPKDAPPAGKAPAPK